MSDTIQCLEHDGWFEITLNRPDQLNSLTDEMHLALRACLQKRKHSARAVLLTGAGRGFCAGQDLGDRDPSKMDGATGPEQRCALLCPARKTNTRTALSGCVCRERRCRGRGRKYCVGL